MQVEESPDSVKRQLLRLRAVIGYVEQLASGLLPDGVELHAGNRRAVGLADPDRRRDTGAAGNVEQDCLQLLLIGSRLVTEFSGDGASAEFADPGECSAVAAEVPQRLGGSRLRGGAVDGDDRADAVEVAGKQLTEAAKSDANYGK